MRTVLSPISVHRTIGTGRPPQAMINDCLAASNLLAWTSVLSVTAVSHLRRLNVSFQPAADIGVAKVRTVELVDIDLLRTRPATGRKQICYSQSRFDQVHRKLMIS